jgi:hypothetical protein
MKTLSLLSGKQCQLQTTPVKTSDVKIQLLQKLSLTSVPIYNCRLQGHFSITICRGIFTHPLPVESYNHNFLLSYEACKDAIKNKIYHVQGYGPPIPINIDNGFGYTSQTIIGERESCSGGTFRKHDGSNTYHNAIVIAQYTIEVLKFEATVNLQSNMIHINTNIIAPYVDHFLFLEQYGAFYWDNISPAICDDSKLRVVYEGSGLKIEEFNETFNTTKTTYSIKPLHSNFTSEKALTDTLP